MCAPLDSAHAPSQNEFAIMPPTRHWRFSPEFGILSSCSKLLLRADVRECSVELSSFGFSSPITNGPVFNVYGDSGESNYFTILS